MNTLNAQTTRPAQDGALIRGIVVGAVVGGVAAWLLAPCSGAELRTRVRDTMTDTRAKVESTVRMLLPGNADQV